MPLSSGRDGPKFGPRKTEFLPYLLVRAFATDHGKRPLGVPFWESPDIFIAPNMDATTAPTFPPTRRGVAQAGAANTIWAQLWNLGKAPAVNARIEFYWFDPSLGFSAASARLIGATTVTLGNGSSGMARTIVKCPVTWVPTYVNGGHECLMVRLFEPLTDPLGPKPWDGSDDRHVGQRNISVVNASSPATLELPLRLGCAEPPGLATLEVVATKVAAMPWLQLLEGSRQVTLKDAAKTATVVGLMPPVAHRPAATRASLGDLSTVGAKLLHSRLDVERGCDELEALFYLRVDGLEKGECRIFRVQQRAGGRLVGGYTVVARRE